MDRAETAAAVLHYAEGTLGPVAFHPDGCGTCARAVELVGQVDRTYPVGGDPMPVFVIKGKDLLAPDAIAAYQNACVARGLNEQAQQVWLALREVAGWQSRNPELVKLPDHQHVPVGSWPRADVGAIERDAAVHAAQLGETPEKYAEG